MFFRIEMFFMIEMLYPSTKTRPHQVPAHNTFSTPSTLKKQQGMPRNQRGSLEEGEHLLGAVDSAQHLFVGVEIRGP